MEVFSISIFLLKTIAVTIDDTVTTNIDDPSVSLTEIVTSIRIIELIDGITSFTSDIERVEISATSDPISCRTYRSIC